MIASWQDLRDLRNLGRAPAKPVIVTTDKRVGYTEESKGSLVVVHEAGQPMPTELLAGLDVVFVFSRCELAGKVARMIRQKEVGTPKTMTAWCECFGELDAMTCACKEKLALDNWINSK